MRHKINIQLLKQSQKYANKLKHPVVHDIYETYYKMIAKLYNDITKPFKHVCIHGNYPHFMIDNFKIKSKDSFQNLVMIGDIKNSQFSNINDENGLKVLEEPQKFDLIISCMETHKYPNPEQLLKKYLFSLKPDGALIGCCFGQRSFSSLNRAYLLAQNQRSGGVSPKVLQFPSIGLLGHMFTTLKYQLPTIISNQVQLEVQSVVDLLTLFQVSGESGIVRGSRKGVYKDVLLSMAAIYDTQNTKNEEIQKEKQVEDNNLNCKQKVEINSFISWKYDESQPKPLRRGQFVEQKNFIDELKAYDQQLKHYQIQQGKDDPEEIK